MDQMFCSTDPIVDRQHGDAAFADEWDRYLRHCAEHGASSAVPKVKRNELLWIARHLDPHARQGVGSEVLLQIAHGSRLFDIMFWIEPGEPPISLA